MSDVTKRVFGLLATAIVAGTLLVGCGGDSKPPPPGTPSAAEFLIGNSVLAEQPDGSPEKALLSWWRSIQYNDFDGYLTALAAPLRARRQGEKQAPTEIALASGELARSQPKVVSVKTSGDGATIYTRIETRQPVGATQFTTSSTPQAFTLIREGGDWKIADDFYVQSRAKIIEEAQKAAEKAAKG